MAYEIEVIKGVPCLVEPRYAGDVDVVRPHPDGPWIVAEGAGAILDDVCVMLDREIIDKRTAKRLLSEVPSEEPLALPDWMEARPERKYV